VFGPGGEGFERINLACPIWVLKEAFERLEKAIKEL
jgi:cystathionine beta-lyase